MGQQGFIISKSSRGECFLAFSSIERLPTFLGSWSFPHITPTSASIITAFANSDPPASFHKNPCDYAGLTWTIQHNLPISKSVTLPHLKSHLSCKVNTFTESWSWEVDIFGGHCSAYYSKQYPYCFSYFQHTVKNAIMLFPTTLYVLNHMCWLMPLITAQRQHAHFSHQSSLAIHPLLYINFPSFLTASYSVFILSLY